MMDSSPSKINQLPTLPALPSTGGTKRPAPSLLPAFEPFSSSPGFPRPSKRQACTSPSERNAFLKYPTPIPTSTTGILSSSPPHIQHPRPTLHRTQSSVSERAPLSAVPSVSLLENGDELLMGRSSNSSHYQLSANKLISRVHVKARYIPATVPLERNKVEIICTGWNGVKVHCHGQTWELAKGDSFTSATESAEIMLDVQDARVILNWPSREQNGALSDASWDEENSPKSRIGAANSRGEVIHSSPLRIGQRLESPESPTPAGPIGNNSLSSLFSESSEKAPVKVYEDASSEKGEEAVVEEVALSQTTTSSLSQLEDPPATQSSELSDPGEEDPDEENDPIVHSFGPFGADISRRMASFTAVGASPEQRGHTHTAVSPQPSPAKRSPSSTSTTAADPTPVINHVINQLAFSRLSSTPLSVILNNLPAALKGASPSTTENEGLTKDDLHKLLSASPCIGEIHREGKDAAGKPLESEYYYIPDEDHDEQRRAAVVDGLRKPSLRNCRKSHKQYYWKRPRTP